VRSAARAAVGGAVGAGARRGGRRGDLARVVGARLEAEHRVDADAPRREIRAARLEAVGREVEVARGVRRVREAAREVVLPGVAEAGVHRVVVALPLADRELDRLVLA